MWPIMVNKSCGTVRQKYYTDNSALISKQWNIELLVPTIYHDIKYTISFKVLGIDQSQ